jgi:hypothetical protein
MADISPDLVLEARTGLPDDLRYLLEKYPREAWQGHPNVHGMAQMWLQRHDMFRELGQMLTGGIADYREGRLTAPQFASWFAPRLNYFLGNLDGHHRIEDGHYFPMFSQAAPEMKRGFEILDADHHAIHGGLHDLAEQSRGLLGAAQAGKADRDIRDLGARLGETLTGFRPLLVRHLDDEEDIVIPLIIERGRTDPRFA